MDLKHIVHQPWDVLPSSPTSQPSPTLSTSTTASLVTNADFHDIDFRKPVLVPVRKLYLNSEQEEAIRSLYIDKKEYRMRFSTTVPSQATAEQLLRKNGLPHADRPHSKLEHCWLTAWSSTWGSKKGVKKRSLFQWSVFPSSFVGPPNEQAGTANSSSGYNTAARQARDKRGSQNPVEWSRQADYDFTGCLAHADVTWNRTSGEIERVIGYFEHSERCQAASLIRSASSET